jgi:GDPmannose 4,6-dehydratase
MKKKVLITGALGQDGTILTEILQNDYELHGVCRLTCSDEKLKTHSEKYNINLLISDLSDINSVNNLIETVNPDIVVNFAGETDVINPWADIHETFNQNFIIPLNLLNSIVKHNKDIFLFQSSSSLMYGKSNEKIINELSKTSPMYPYGISKLSTHNLMSEYRTKYGIKCSSGIFFNHESHYRSNKFISKKISSLIGQIIKGNIKKINLYDLNFYRDISHAEDFMNGLKIIIDNKIDDDFIFSSGNQTNMLEFSKRFFTIYNLDFYDYVNYTDSGNYYNEYDIIGDNNKLKSIGWNPKYSIDDLITDMINKEIK